MVVAAVVKAVERVECDDRSACCAGARWIEESQLTVSFDYSIVRCDVPRLVMARRGQQRQAERQLALLVDSDAQGDTRHDASSVSTSWSPSLSIPSLHVAMRETPTVVHS